MNPTTVTADEQRRVALPNPARPGGVFAVEEAGHARFILTRAEESSQPVRLERKNGYLVAVTDHPIAQEGTPQEDLELAKTRLRLLQ